MEAPIRYAHTADGVNIAFWAFGRGEPLIYMAGAPWCHVELLQIPGCVRWYEHLAEDRTLVRYDVRGTGLSDREIEDHSLSAQLLDLEAVIRALGLENFSLFAAASAGPVAIAYAAENPERVSNLVLWCSWAKASEILSPRLAAWRGLLDQDWQLMTDTCAQIALGWSEGEVGRLAAENLRESVTPGVMRAGLDAAESFDVSGTLRNVKAPTLVFSRPNISWIPAESARRLAAGIPDSQLSILDGESTAPYLGDTATIIAAMQRFLDPDDQQSGDDHEVNLKTHSFGAGPLPRRDVKFPSGLTEREVQVLSMVAGGKTNIEVAEELVLSIRTVERHIGNIYAKIGARGRADATVFALTHGLV